MVAASVVDDGAIVEDGGELWKSIVVLSVAVVVFRQSCGCCIVVDAGAIVEMVRVLWKSILLLSVVSWFQTELWLLHQLLMLVLYLRMVERFCGSQYCCCISSVIVSDRVVVAASVLIAAIVEDGGEVVVEVNIVVASVAVVVSDRVVVAASVVDDGAIVEDGGEVVWKSQLLFYQ